MIPASQPVQTQTIPVKPEALVLGGGIVGISIAQSLAQAGIHVTLVEKGPLPPSVEQAIRAAWRAHDDGTWVGLP